MPFQWFLFVDRCVRKLIFRLTLVGLSTTELSLLSTSLCVCECKWMRFIHPNSRENVELGQLLRFTAYKYTQTNTTHTHFAMIWADVSSVLRTQAFFHNTCKHTHTHSHNQVCILLLLCKFTIFRDKDGIRGLVDWANWIVLMNRSKRSSNQHTIAQIEIGSKRILKIH